MNLPEINYPSCSEIVGVVSVSAIKDVRAALKEAEKLTGLRVCATYLNPEDVQNKKIEWGERRTHIVPVNIDNLVLESDDEDGYGLHLKPRPTDIPKGYRLVLIDAQEPKAIPEGKVQDISIYCYVDEGLRFQVSDGDEWAFPALRKMEEKDLVDVQSEGGSMEAYEDWRNGVEYGDDA